MKTILRLIETQLFLIFTLTFLFFNEILLRNSSVFFHCK